MFSVIFILQSTIFKVWITFNSITSPSRCIFSVLFYKLQFHCLVIFWTYIRVLTQFNLNKLWIFLGQVYIKEIDCFDIFSALFACMNSNVLKYNHTYPIHVLNSLSYNKVISYFSKKMYACHTFDSCKLTSISKSKSKGNS